MGTVSDNDIVPISLVGRRGSMARDRRLEYARAKIKRDIARAESRGDYQQAAELRAVRDSRDLARMNATHERIMSGLRPGTPKATSRAPRAKTISDKIYNARRRLIRQAESLLRQAKMQTETSAEMYRSFASMLKEAAEKNKGKRLSAMERVKELQRLAKIRARTIKAAYGMTSTFRRNLIFMQQMNAAGTKGASSSISDRAKSIFWVATKGLWPSGANVPRNERYKRIQEHFYFSETSDAVDFRRWLEERGIDVERRIGDLNLILEYLLELNKDVPGDDGTDFDYEGYKRLILTSM